MCNRRPKYKDEKRNIVHPCRFLGAHLHHVEQSVTVISFPVPSLDCGKTCADVQAKALGLAQTPSSAPQSAVTPTPNSDTTANLVSSSSASSTPISRFSPNGDSASSNSPTRKAILFYHQGEPYYGFTNFSAHPIEYLNRVYPTSEHLFQAFKVYLFVEALFSKLQ